MPIFIFEPDAFDKLVLIEGPDYECHRDDTGICSFKAFWERFELMKLINPDIANRKSKTHLEVDGNNEIYGKGGFNRYIVLNNGEILFQKFNASKDARRKAREIGFRIFPTDVDKENPLPQRVWQFLKKIRKFFKV